MNWRLASRLSVITLAIIVVITVTLIQQQRTRAHLPQQARTSPTALQGTGLGNTPAPDFHLTDQYGKPISLSQFRGKPVVLTFLYTNCPDQCPLTAEKLHTTVQQLGNSGQDVAFIAVSTDPQYDTVHAALKFSREHNMQDAWHYLVGNHMQLASVWKSYNIYAQPNQQTVNHSLGLYLIDKQGHERVFLNSDFTPEQLTQNLQTLLKE